MTDFARLSPRSLALASFRLESSPSSAIQVDRECSGGSRSVYAVMSDGLRPAIAGLARPRLVAARIESLLRYLAEPRVQWGLDGDIRIGALTAGLAAGPCPPGVQGGIGKPDGEVASSCRPTSYSRQFGTRYRDFACLYWLRFGYFTGDDSRLGASAHHEPRSRAMHQCHAHAVGVTIAGHGSTL